ncbi:putative membrane protein YgcG [Sporosarcina luteola]|nr:putative membrane protein YgcG [Sporosarcina luteola]
MKKVVCALCLLLLLTIVQSPVASAKSFSIDQVDINAYVLDNGDLYVEELFTYTFSGAYNGTTRTIGNENHAGVQYFEGYLAPMDTDLANYDNSTFAPLQVEREDLTFKIHTPSENEQKKVFYRYLISGAAQKYQDTGQLYWRFFDDMNDTDIHNLRIRFLLSGDRDATLAGKAYLHSFTGKLSKSDARGFVYTTDKLEAYGKVEIRFLFPDTFLKNAPYTRDEPKLAEFTAEEAAYANWMMKREKALPTVEGLNIFFLGTALFLFLIAILYPRRLYRLFISKPRIHQLEEVDSFLLSLIERKGKIKPAAISAALLRLRQKGIVTMEKLPSNAIYRSDDNAPDYTFRFKVVKDTSSLNDYEKDMIDWLFEKDAEGTLVFSLDQFPFLTKQQREKNWRLDSDYSSRSKQLIKRFKEWQKIVQKDPDVMTYVAPNPVRKYLMLLGVPLWIAFACLNLWMLNEDTSDIGILLLLVIAGSIVLRVKRNWRIALPIYFVWGIICMEGLSDGTDEVYALFAIGTILLSITALLLPLRDIKRKAAPYYKGAKAFMKDVKSGEFDFQSRYLADKWYEHAISLGLFIPLFVKYTKNVPEDLASLPPMTVHLTELLTAFHYTHHYYYTHMHSSSGSGGSSGGSGGSGSGGGGGAGAF